MHTAWREIEFGLVTQRRRRGMDRREPHLGTTQTRRVTRGKTKALAVDPASADESDLTAEHALHIGAAIVGLALAQP